MTTKQKKPITASEKNVMPKEPNNEDNIIYQRQEESAEIYEDNGAITNNAVPQENIEDVEEEMGENNNSENIPNQDEAESVENAIDDLEIGDTKRKTQNILPKAKSEVVIDLDKYKNDPDVNIKARKDRRISKKRANGEKEDKARKDVEEIEDWEDTEDTARSKGTTVLKENLEQFGSEIKLALKRLFGVGGVPVKVVGDEREVNSFLTLLDREKNYIEKLSEYGLDKPATFRSKSELKNAIEKFERETGIRYPFHV